jgi:hypothetical protein
MFLHAKPDGFGTVIQHSLENKIARSGHNKKYAVNNLFHPPALAGAFFCFFTAIIVTITYLNLL